MMTRRGVLATGTAAVTVLGLSGCQGEGLETARAPWAQASVGFGDPRLDALAYAVLAPSPHNRQPWLVRLEEDGFTLLADRTRLLPETDPPNRQIVLGLGAFLEMFRLAAAQKGRAVDAQLWPEGEPQPVLDDRPVARVRMVPGGTPDPLFAYALERRTNRTAFRDETVDRAALDRMARSAAGGLAGGAHGFGRAVEPGAVRRVAEIASAGWHQEVALARTHEESITLTRVGAEAIAADPDGISLSGPMIGAYRRLGLMTPEKQRNPGSVAYKGALPFYDDLIDSARAFTWLTTPANDRATQLRAGAAWVRYQLAAAREGLALQPLSQVLQEFPEMAPHYAAFHEAVSVRAPSRVQGLFRVGRAKAPPPSPRWPLESRLIT